MAGTVLLVLSSDDILTAATDELRAHAYDVVPIHDPAATISAWQSHRPVAVVIGGENRASAALEACRRLRAASDVPIVVLSTSGDEVDELLAFAVGADDCMTGRFSGKRLAARVDALVRRRSGTPAYQLPDALGYGPLLMNLKSRTVSVRGLDVPLTRTEFEMLYVLLEHPDNVISREELIRRIWGEWAGDSHVVEVHMSRLRSKILKAGGPRVGESVRGVGYRLVNRNLPQMRRS